VSTIRVQAEAEDFIDDRPVALVVHAPDMDVADPAARKPVRFGPPGQDPAPVEKGGLFLQGDGFDGLLPARGRRRVEKG